MQNATHIIEDSANQFWAVWPTRYPGHGHLFNGIAVKRAKGGFVPKAKARQMLVRKECTRVIATLS